MPKGGWWARLGSQMREFHVRAVRSLVLRDSSLDAGVRMRDALNVHRRYYPLTVRILVMSGTCRGGAGAHALCSIDTGTVDACMICGFWRRPRNGARRTIARAPPECVLTSCSRVGVAHAMCKRLCRVWPCLQVAVWVFPCVIGSSFIRDHARWTHSLLQRSVLGRQFGYMQCS